MRAAVADVAEPEAIQYIPHFILYKIAIFLYPT